MTEQKHIHTPKTCYNNNKKLIKTFKRNNFSKQQQQQQTKNHHHCLFVYTVQSQLKNGMVERQTQTFFHKEKIIE